MTSRVLLGMLAVSALACDPIMSVRADVRSIPDAAREAGEPAYDERPIVGAKLTLVCPEREPLVLGTTDAAGKSGYTTIGLLDADCAVHVEASGYHSDEVRVGDLCVFRSGSSCHFMAALFELVPTSSASATAPSPPPARATTTLRVKSTTRGISVFVREDSKSSGELVAYDALGSAPTSATLPQGKYRIAAALGDREPVEAPEPVDLSAPERVELAYSDRSTLRTLKTVSLLVGIVVGPTIAAVGSTQHGVAKGVLIGSGAAVGVGGVLFGIDLAETHDELGVRVLPAQ